jgi:Transposase, Mutator family
MSIQFVAGKLKGEERKAIIQGVQRQLQEAVLGAIKPLLTEFCEEELTVKLGRGKRESRRVGGQAREIEWQCAHCGCRDANHFTRDGHYRRALETGWGHIEGLQVPMVECQCCGHDVVCTYTILEKYRRFWLDLAQQVLIGLGLCQSLRQMSEQWSAVLGSSVGLRTINERINQLEPLLQQARSEPITDVPAVVQFDGIWLRVQTQAETVKLDKRGRKRKKRKGKKVVLLVALGLWTDGSGKREILDWQVADGESKAAWEPDVASVVGTGSTSRERAASGDPRWPWRVRRGHRLGLWKHGARATLHVSQAAQCRRQEPRGTQRGGEQGNAEAVDGAGQRHLSSRECPGSETAFDDLCQRVASAHPQSRGNVGARF